MNQYPRRLIEVDLPIKRISVHARREKSIRHGHISTLHIWWARRPLAACRAVICAALWPDPVDLAGWASRGAEVLAGNTVIRPQRFLDAARACMTAWAMDHAGTSSAESYPNLIAVQNKPETLANPEFLRRALLDFIADFSNWDNSTDRAYLATARTLAQAAHEALGGAPGTRPLLVDPFAGGGSIPLEALRVGADTFASDLNPIAVLLNTVLLEYTPKYGQRLADGVRQWGASIKQEAERKLGEFYPKDPDGATPIAYLWARTIRCEGPGCGAEVPIITQPSLAQRRTSAVVLEIIPDAERKTVEIGVSETRKTTPPSTGTVQRSAVTCPVCGHTTPAANVRKQFENRKGGVSDARLLAVVTISASDQKKYRASTLADCSLVERARVRVMSTTIDNMPAVPNEPLPYLRSIFNIHLLGATEWGNLFSSRQALLLTTFAGIIRNRAEASHTDPETAAVITCLALALDKMADFHTSLATWIRQGEKIGHTFGRQALGIIWDYAEANPFGNISGSWERCVDYVAKVIEHEKWLAGTADVAMVSATEHPLPDDSAEVFFTDPPYYDAVPYVDLSDFFYVWLKRSIGNVHESLFGGLTSPKEMEIVQLAERNKLYANKTRENFERRMAVALSEGRRITAPSGISVIVFAHKTTQAWETMLQAVIDGGWIVVASWPIDTERQGRLRAMGSAALGSSVHLVCRPRENPDGSVRTTEIGDWRDVLDELPKRIRSWLPHLAEEGVVGADAIFACLGPALEIFSRYARVEKASGEQVTLREYLEQVWAVVAREALSMIFEGAETTGFEADARLTAMWLWTLNTSVNGGDGDGIAEEESEDDATTRPAKLSGYFLEYDPARKIAQGLGAHLDKLTSVVEVKGDKARLLPAAERAAFLFGRERVEPGLRRRGKPKQLDMFGAIGEAEESAGVGVASVFRPGETALDRLHQAMLLFAAGRGEALKRFLVEEGVGRDQRLWQLAQALSALYPTHTEEKRWVDGVLARKKGLGL